MTATATETAARFTTREEWLVAAVELLARDVFNPSGIDLPAVRVSVGWPGGRGNKNAVIGQCWASAAASDKVAQLFISPKLDDAVRVLDVLSHELVHAADDCQSGHKGRFAKWARIIGLEGKLTATVAGDELTEKLSAIAEELGLYPHAALASVDGAEGPKKQTTRMLKLEAPCCGYIVRTTAKWIEVGMPSCPCGNEMGLA